ncbi:MAG: hypothetical protein R3F56_21925 [Planctomycetota bacterium]
MLRFRLPPWLRGIVGDMGERTTTMDLLARWRARDMAALDALLRRDLDWIRRRVHAQVGPGLRAAGDTEDFVQDAAIELLKDGPRFVLSSRAQFRALLAQILANVLRAGHRRLHALKRDAGRNQPLPSDTVLDLDASCKQLARPEEAAALAEEREWLRLGVLLLDPDDQTVIDLHWAGHTDEEIGECMGTNANAARMRRARATDRLARVVRKLKNGQLRDVLRPAAAEDD